MKYKADEATVVKDKATSYAVATMVAATSICKKAEEDKTKSDKEKFKAREMGGGGMA